MIHISFFEDKDEDEDEDNEDKDDEGVNVFLLEIVACIFYTHFAGNKFIQIHEKKCI